MKNLNKKIRLVTIISICVLFIAASFSSADDPPSDADDDWDYWSNSPHMFSNVTGNVGIGTTNPSAKLDVQGSAVFNENGGNHDFRIESDTLSSIFKIDADRDEIQTGVPHEGLSVDVIFTLANNGNAPFEVIACSNTPVYRGLMNFYRSRGTVASPSAVQDGDFLGDLKMKAYDGSSWKPACQILAQVDGTPVSGSYTPGKLVFRTTGDASGLKERLMIRSNGDIIVNDIGEDCDFRIEGDTDPYLFFVDALTGRVGIGTNNLSSKLTVQGNINILDSNGSLVVEVGEGLDYAEGFDVTNKEEVGPGTVMIIDPENPGKLTISTQAYDKKVAGIIAGANGLGSGVKLGSGKYDHDVALVGRVYCNLDATKYAIQPGDLLTTSNTPGYAMKVTDYNLAQGAILGKAMERMEEGDKGQILVLVTLQ